jgi:hypothetical protein
VNSYNRSHQLNHKAWIFKVVIWHGPPMTISKSTIIC